MKTLIYIAIGAVMCSCCNSGSQDKPLAAQPVAENVRSAWEKSVMPIAIVVGNQISGLNEVGVYADMADALPEERQAFHGAVFKRKGIDYVCENPNAVTSDSMVSLSVCYPVREGLSPNTPLHLSAPFNENLYAKETSRIDTIAGYAYVSEVEMLSSMAVLQLVTESADISDMLNGLKVYGDGLAISGTYKPYTGEWTELSNGGFVEATDADCLMGNGREHNLYLVPTSEPVSVQIFALVNGTEMSVKTILPPMAAGSLTRLNLRKEAQSLKISGSWVATKRPIAINDVCPVDTVKVGHFLRKDGYVVSQLDSLCLAMVIETDGKHGKAVAINDSDGSYFFNDRLITTGNILPTIDGIRVEGKINPIKEDNISADNTIVIMPNSTFNNDCALGYNDGAQQTCRLMTQFAKPKDESMLMEVQRRPSSYVPSLAELAQLYCKFNPVKGSFEINLGIETLNGQYLTSSESSPATVYMIDFDGGIITGASSKQYTKAKLRLFYLF